MKIDRPGLAIIIAFFVGGGAYEMGTIKTAALVFLLVVSLSLYKSLKR